MKNLEQIRAASALDYADCDAKKTNSDGGNVVKKLPALIMSNGLLAAAAFSYQKQEDEINRQRKNFNKLHKRLPREEEEQNFEDNGFYTCFDYLVRHLQHPDVALLPKDVKIRNSSGPKLRQLDVLLSYLTGETTTSQDLKLITEEALAWLAYARRFVRKETENGDSDDSD
jgi:CRISPR/Cas system CMR-associated protein Cmr5 small subunit